MKKLHFEIESLPLEMIVRIFKNLSYGDLQRVVQASRRLHKAGSDPSLWFYCSLNKAYVVERGLNHLVTNIPRFRLIKRLDLCGANFLTDANIGTIFSESINTKLEEINLYSINLSSIPAQLVAKAIGRLKRANLKFTRLQKTQLEAVLEEISKPENSQFQEIDLGFINLEEVDVYLVANSLARLATVFLYKSRLTTEQARAFLTKVKNSPRLEILNLHGIDLSRVPAQVLTQAISSSKLTKLNLMGTNLTEEQRHHLFLASPQSKSLETLNVHGLDISHVPAPVLSTAVTRLTSVHLWRTNLTPDQIKVILQTAASSKTLQDLNLGYVNLSLVPPLTIVEGIRNLRKANLMKSCMTPLQCDALMAHLVDCDTLVDINMNYVNLSSVDPDTLAGAVSRLEAADVSYTSLSIQQCTRLLEKCMENTRLKYLSLCGVKTQTGYRGGWMDDNNVREFNYLFRKVRVKIKRVFVKQCLLRATPTLFYERRLFFNDQDNEY